MTVEPPFARGDLDRVAADPLSEPASPSASARLQIIDKLIVVMVLDHVRDYAAWLAVLLILWPISTWYAGIKARRRDWWLSYL